VPIYIIALLFGRESVARSAAARARRRGSSGAVRGYAYRRAGPRCGGYHWYGLGLWARCPWARTPAPGSHLSSSTGVYTIGARLPLGMPRQQIRAKIDTRNPTSSRLSISQESSDLAYLHAALPALSRHGTRQPHWRWPPNL